MTPDFSLPTSAGTGNRLVSVFRRIARLAVRACPADWAAVYVGVSALAMAEAPGRPPAQHLFADLAWPPAPSTSELRPSGDLRLATETDLLDTVLPAQAPRFLVAIPLAGLPDATLCIASADVRTPDEDLWATLSDLAELGSSAVPPSPDAARTRPSRSTTSQGVRSGRRADARERQASASHVTTPAAKPKAIASSGVIKSRDTPALAFIEWDERGCINDWNDAATEMFGYTKAEAQALHAFDIVAPEYWDHVQSVWEKQFDQNGGYFSYNANITKEGERIVCEWYNTPLVNDGGEVHGVMSLVHDVTTREKNAQAIRESKEFAENLIVSVQDGVVVFNDAGTTIQVNDAFCQMTGFAREDLLGTTLPYPFWPPEEYEMLCRVFDMSSQASLTQEARLRRHDGTTFPAVVHRSPMRNNEGNIVSVVVTVHDMTEQKAAERGLAREQDLLENIFGAIPVMIAVYDAENGLLRVNQAFKTVVGNGVAELPGMRVELDPSGRTVMRSFIDALPDTWTDISVTRQDQTVVESSWIRIRSSGGTRIAIGIDVTERIQHAHALERARDAAEELSRLQTSFLTNMSHEIRTPLTSILGFSEAIRESIAQPEIPVDALTDVVEFVRQIESGGLRLLHTLNSVLDLSRLEAGSMTLHPQRVSIGQVVRTVAAEYDEAIDVDIQAPDLCITTDLSAARRVLLHVIDNAVKFTPPGGDIRCVLREADGGVEIRVEDTGVGIDPDFVPRIFHPFEQESSGKGRSHEGSGLGLPVTSRLLGLMGGTIAINSSKGAGTDVTVWLPYHVDE